MSFLKHILSSVDETDTLEKNLPEITTQIVSYKEEVLKFIDDVYYKFVDWPKHNQKLLDVSTQLTVELSELQQRVKQVTTEELEKTNMEIGSLIYELDRKNIVLSIVTRLVEIQEILLTFRDLQKNKLYFKAAHEIKNLNDLINGIPENDSIDALVILKNNVDTERATILIALHEMFHNVVKVHSKVTNNIQTNTIKISQLEQPALLEALDILNGFDETLDRLAKFVLEVCNGVINNIASIKMDNDGSYHILTVAIKKTVVKSQRREIFTKLIEIFAFLNLRFNHPINSSQWTMAYLGKVLGPQLADILLRDCLDKTKPTKTTDFTTYEKTMREIFNFQEKLVEFNIFESENEILNHAKAMDLILIEQKCNNYLASAITLMKKDLHDSVEVGDKCGDDNVLMPEQFPKSFVSRSAIDVLVLARKILDEALTINDACAARLICTVQSIFFQYGSIVHGHHERLLMTIPQQVALFRNNCLYIAHNLVQLNKEYSSKFSTTALPSPPLFTDQGHQLRTIGGEIFLGYIDDQVRYMDMMVDEYFTPLQVADKLTPDLDRLIRQCLRQYELLRTVWTKILPQSVYNKSVGYLFNTFCKKLIAAIVSAQDIPSTNAEQLVDMLQLVTTRGPRLFSNKEEVFLHVEVWPKINDLIFVLSASLASISDMWAEGTGPLTITFTAEEIRNLIKALFQNTDRRAAVLSKIH